jgi:DNA modification methylase
VNPDARPPRWLDYVDLDDLQPAEVNPKDHQLQTIGANMAEHGLFDVVAIIDERTGRMLAGHGRRERLQADRDAGKPPPEGTIVEGGRWLVPRLRGWASKSDDHAMAAGAAHNQTTTAGGWKRDELEDLVRHLDESTPHLVPTLGFDDDELAELLAAEEPSGSGGLSDPDDIPEDAPALTQPGDCWRLGDHLLICADATKVETYPALLGELRPVLLLTDPPYGVAYQQASTKRAILGDLSQATIPLSMASLLPHLHEDARLVMFGGSDQFAMYLGLFDHYLHQQPRIVVWVKDNFILRHHGFHSQFELAYYGWQGKGGAVWTGKRDVSDVWTIPRTRETDHITEKPVALFEIPIRTLTEPGDIILEPFAGSGTGIIAAQRLGRTVRALEKDPHWCDVIARRWQTFTGEMPRLIERADDGSETSEPHDFLGEP